MEKAIIGKKVGMTQIFDEAGKVIPVTVIQAGPCTVVQKKTEEKDGYTAVQLGFEEVPERKLSKPELGHSKKAGKALRVLGFKGQQGRGHAKGIEPVADARKANRHRVRGSLNHGFRLRRHPVHIAPVAFGQRGAGAPFPHHKIAL